MAPIRIIGPTGDVSAYGLFDTGADDTLLPSAFLGPLGIVIQPGESATQRGESPRKPVTGSKRDQRTREFDDVTDRSTARRAGH